MPCMRRIGTVGVNTREVIALRLIKWIFILIEKDGKAWSAERRLFTFQNHSLFCFLIIGLFQHCWGPIILGIIRSYIRWDGMERLETVLIQDHFYSPHLLFAPANKTPLQSRMIRRTPLSVNGNRVDGLVPSDSGWSSITIAVRRKSHTKLCEGRREYDWILN